MSDTYDFAFGEDTVYAAVRDLLAGLRRSGTVLDLGCGFGALAEAVAALGMTYVGADVDADGLTALERRGFATARLDLEDLEGLERLLTTAADGPLAAVLMLDTLEHLARPERVLETLNRTAPAVGNPALVVSVPNVTHTDLAAKLVLGRWDVTDTGLLDRTHLQLFSASRLTQVMRGTGWFECGRNDFSLNHSDQHFPEGLPVLDPAAPLARLLREVRADAEPSAWVNQFVRAYVAGVPVPEPAAQPETAKPFLSVLVRTRGTRPETLRDLLLCLSAQTDGDFEVLLLAHGATAADVSEVGVLLAQQPAEMRERTTLVQVPPGGSRSRPLNVGVARARGRYVCVVDDDDVVLSSYVAEFRQLAETSPGQVLRTVVVEQDIEQVGWAGGAGHAAASPFRYAYPPAYDVLAHLVENYTPFCGFAVPRSFFTDLGQRFDESLPVLEDWDVQLRAVQVCGVASSPLPTSIYRRWRRGSGDHSNALHHDEHWKAARGQVLAKGDARPLLLPPGSMGVLHRRLPRGEVEDELLLEIGKRGEEMQRLADEVAAARAARDDLLSWREQVLQSSSWRITAPLRALAGPLRAVRRR